jgi:hypothetical protein
MDLFDVKLAAGVESQTSVSGRYFRILSGAGRLRIKASNGADSAIITGIGVDLGRFEWFRLTSETDQTVTVLVSDLPTTDSRLTGDVDVNGLLSVVNSGGSAWAQSSVTLAAATAAEILSANPDRLSGTLQPEGDMYIGAGATVSDTNGVLITGGQVVNIENTAALWGYSVGANTVQLMESIK